jgi:hydroxysqualene dehydroxylase
LTASHVHVIGAGLAGLSAAVALSQAGRAVTVLEAGPAAGGRCRSYFDRELGLRIDNGNHLLLSGNRAAFAYVDAIGSRQTLAIPDQPVFPFMDLGSGLAWTLRPNLGRIPWWVLSHRRRVPGTLPADYLALRRLLRPNADATVAASLRHDTLFHRLVEPLAIAALNTPPDESLARLLGAVVRETLLRGGSACIPAFPCAGLSESLIDPAVAWLRARGNDVLLSHRVVALGVADGRLNALHTTDGRTSIEAAVLAVPPWVAPGLLPGLVAPDQFQAILNIHFRVDANPGPAGFVGLIGGKAEWVFIKRGHVSVTISAANRIVDQGADAIAAAVWPDVQAALGLRGPLPPWRVVKERRATFAATATQERLRPGARTGVANLVLAGDWTATGLPATIEGAIRSGRTAAEALLAA